MDAALRSPEISDDEHKVLSPINDMDGSTEIQDADHDPEESKSQWYLFLLALAIGGLQICWSVELSYGSPYLLSLGLSKSMLALVWIAGPLSGTLVQPYIGIKSDNCRIPWGRRKPFIVGGAAATISSLLGLSWAKEIVGGIFGIFGVHSDAQIVATSALVIAVLLVYVLDFAINAIQAAVRAFIVDCAPTHQQEDANAWAGRISGVGNILGYLSGYFDLPRYMPFFGNSQFKVLCAIAAIALTVTTVISCASISEMDPRLRGEPSNQQDGVMAFFRNLYHAIRRLSPQIRRICWVQFFSWMSWFPFLFYISTYVGELYVEPFFQENPNLSDEEIDVLWEKGTRVGAFALLVFAITNFASSVFLPLIIAPTYRPPQRNATPATPLTPSTPNLSRAISSSQMSGTSGYFALPTKPATSRKKHRFSFHSKNAWSSTLEAMRIPGLTLRRAWLLSLLLFALCMSGFTYLVKSPWQAIILISVIGIPWALTNWAPFALIAAEISKQDAVRRRRRQLLPSLDEIMDSEENGILSDMEATVVDDEHEDEAGVILGIHNVFIAAPQIISTLGSSVVFRLLQKGRGQPGDNSVAWVLRLGGLAALPAAWIAWRYVGDGGPQLRRK